MAQHQIVQRHTDRVLAARAAGISANSPTPFQGQAVHADELQAILNMLGGGFENSTAMEIVNPATGRFYQQDGISASGGTDDPRP